MKNNMHELKPKTTARLATLDELVETTIPLFIAPVPSRETLRNWFDRAHIPRFKSNPTARRGGGAVYYGVAAVEKFLRQTFTNCPRTLANHGRSRDEQSNKN